jgi:hypothetical protein
MASPFTHSSLYLLLINCVSFNSQQHT